MCRTGTDFNFNPPLLYYCSAGSWGYFSVLSYVSTLPRQTVLVSALNNLECFGYIFKVH